MVWWWRVRGVGRSVERVRYVLQGWRLMGTVGWVSETVPKETGALGLLCVGLGFWVRYRGRGLLCVVGTPPRGP